MTPSFGLVLVTMMSSTMRLQPELVCYMTRVTEARITLHWLPIRAGSTFKFRVFDFKIVYQPNLIPNFISVPFSTTGNGRTTKFNVSNTLKCDFERRLLTVGGRKVPRRLLK